MEVRSIKKRFLALNRERMMRTRACLREKQSNFLDLLPLLFHVNHPVFPGFISKSTPKGISDYAPSQRTLNIAKKLLISFEYQKRALPNYDIYSLFLIGSSGTVAYSTKSDFDVWVCHREGLDPLALMELKEKTQAIEQWAETFDLEVHFFLMEADAFQKNTIEQLSSESSGSAQRHLLLEEFYRTALLLAGRYPVWWLIPPDREESYQSYIKELTRKRFISDSEFIDFGCLPPSLPAEEFFGAALWQLYKGVDSPYKSVLKILLMEIYASEHPRVELLSRQFKRAIYAGETNLDRLDPYVTLINRIETYLQQRDEHERLSLARRCFYFKVNDRLSEADTPRNTDWRRELMRSVVARWGWSKKDLIGLDERNHWRIQRVVEERRVLVDELTHSYQFLSDFVRKNARLTTINQRDLNILGRKLYAAFERKAGKVEVVNRGIAPNLWESHLTFHHARGQNEQAYWLLFDGVVTPADATVRKPLKRSHSIVELLAWCYFNQVMDINTAVGLYTQPNGLSMRELRTMIETFQRHFADAVLDDASFDDLARAAHIEQSLLFINLGLDPMESLTREGKHLTTNRTDSLSYGGIYENLALTFDQIMVTSWKEVLTARYSGVEGLLNCLCNYIKQSPPSSGGAPPMISAHCFSSGRGTAIGKRIEQLFSEVINCFYDARSSGIRYMLAIENIYYVLTLTSDLLHYKKIGGYADLMAYLTSGQNLFQALVFDSYALKETIFPAIYKVNKSGVVQLFCQPNGALVDIYVLDERGTLFFQRTEFYDIESLYNQYKLFFDSVRYRQHFQAPEGEMKDAEVILECYQARKDHQGQLRLTKRSVNHIKRARGYINVQVIGEVNDDKPAFTFYCDDNEFSTLEHGNAVFDEVAKYVLHHRASGAAYPIYITDIDIPAALIHAETAGVIQTSHYLNYKKNVETRLNEALKAVGTAGTT
ncbi:MAG: class I adenylate cyclase [Gammaproteobacteria bacterium]|nr:class I adenylate cyclase [Gammaproteobacteria bacterium]